MNAKAILLLAGLLATPAWAYGPVSVPADGEHNGSLSARNGTIDVGTNTVVNGDAESRNGRIRIRGGATIRNLKSRNGGITLGAGAEAAELESRNGSVSLGDGARIISVETRNGGIRLSTGVEVQGSVGTRNGAIQGEREVTVGESIGSRNGHVELRTGSSVGGSIATRNGHITLVTTEVSGSVTGRNGDITLRDRSRVGENVTIILDDDDGRHRGGFLGLFGSVSYSDVGDIRIESGSHVDGDVIVQLPEGYDGEQPTVAINADSRVDGTVRVDHRVRLEIADGARVNDVQRSGGEQ